MLLIKCLYKELGAGLCKNEDYIMSVAGMMPLKPEGGGCVKESLKLACREEYTVVTDCGCTSLSYLKRCTI